MSTIQNDGKENSNNRRMSGISQSGKASVAASIKTPSKSTRYSLGSASKYYFKYVNSSAKKKSKSNASFSRQEDDPDFYLKTAFHNEEDTGNLSLLSIPEMAGHNNNNSSLDTSVLSLGNSSSSDEESDLLNKSTLSDTTELTASNFVLAATSRHKMREIALDNSVWTKKAPAMASKEPPKPPVEQPPSVRKPLGNKQSMENTPKIRATLSQDSTGTAAATPSNRRLSMRGVSPSLRSRISASPKSLRKFTEDLKNSRLQRQIQREEDAKKNAAANLALLNSSAASALESSLLLDGSELSITKKKRSRSSMAPRVDKKDTSMMSNGSNDSTDDILGAMDEIFGMVDSDENTETLSQQPKRSSVTATPSAVVEALSQEEPREENPRRDSIPAAVVHQRSRRSSSIMERPLLLDEKEDTASIGKEQQATPSKLAPTPKPRLLDSPARNTRSAKKRMSHGQNDDTASLGDIGDILGGDVSDSMSVEASKEEENVMKDAPLEENGPSFGSTERSESDSNDETAPINVVGDLLSQLTQESSGQHEKNGDQEGMKSPAVSVSPKDMSPQQRKASEENTPKNLAPTPQRSLLDSPARNTRSAKKRQSYSTASDADSIADLGSVLETDVEKPSSENSSEHANAKSPAVTNVLTQRSVGSEEKTDVSNGGDATETASLGDLGSIFGGLTQESPDSKQDEDSAEHGAEENMKSPAASASRSPEVQANKRTTPRKLAPTPQRNLLDSPARNTRSAAKRLDDSIVGDKESTIDHDGSMQVDEENPSFVDTNENQSTESPASDHVLTQRSIGSEEKAGISNGGDATETASLGDLGSIFGALTQESADGNEDREAAEHGNQGDINSQAARMSQKPMDSPLEAKEASPAKLAPTPQRMENPRLLDSPARNTRSAKKQQSAAGDVDSVAGLGSIIEGDDSKPSSINSNEQQNSESPAVGHVLTQLSVGSEEKADMLDGGDVTETASIGDLGSIFGGLTQASTDSNSPMAPRKTYLGTQESPVTGETESSKSETEKMPIEDGARTGSGEDTEMSDHSVKHGTPAKLAPTPQRMEKPRLLDSPARNTRSAKKQQKSSNDEETVAAARLGDVLEGSPGNQLENLISQKSFGSEEKAITSRAKDNVTETASVGDIGDILGALPHAAASNPPSHEADSAALNSPPRLDRNSMKENNFEASNHKDSLNSTSVGAQGEEHGSHSPFSSPNHDLRQDSFVENASSTKSKVSEMKSANSPQRIENPRLLDSPARNTRSAKKNQSQVEVDDTSNHTASIADLSDIFGDSVKGLHRETSMIRDQSPSPSENNNLSQRSFGSAEKGDLQDDATDTGTASLGDIRDILGGLSSSIQSRMESPKQEDNQSPKEMDEDPKRQPLSSPSETNFLSQSSFGSEEKSIKGNGQNEGDITETATINDIGDIFGGLSNVQKAARASIDSQTTTNRTVDSEETELESSFNGSNEKQNISTVDDLNIAQENNGSHVAGDQSTPPTSPPRSTENEKPFSGLKTRATPTKLPPTPQRIPNPRLLDSPARNTRSARKQNDNSNALDPESNQGVDAISSHIDTMDHSEADSPLQSEITSQRAFGSGEKSTKDREEETETASIEDIGNILGGLREDPMHRSDKSTEDATDTSTSNEGSASPERSGVKSAAKATETVVIENPRLLDSPARNTRSAKRKHSEDADTSASTTTNSRVSMSSSIPSSESNDESQRIQLTQQSFDSDLSRDDENDTRTTASMEEINSILFELAQQAPAEGSPTAELNPINQTFGESQKTSRSLNMSQVSNAPQQGPEQLDNSNMSMTSAGDDTTMHSSASVVSGKTMAEETPKKSATTPASLDRSRDIRRESHSTMTSAQKSPMRLTPNSHVKPTPTKIKPSPRRVLNPMSIYSPARKTRSAKKAAEEQSSKRKMPPYNSEDLRSPMPKKFKPVGILSSMKRRQKTDTGASKRGISFGSPEAALYHVGSPSGSFTPLPRSRAKELFAIPGNNASASSSDESREETVGIESNLNILVDKITADNMKESPELSPIANEQDSSRIQNFIMSGEKDVNETEDRSEANVHTAELEVNMEELLANAGEGAQAVNEHTVQLEPGMEQVLANAMHSRRQSPKSDRPLLNTSQRSMDESQRSMDTQDSSPANSSIDLADNHSIASMNARTEKYTSEFKMTAMEAQKLDFSMRTSPQSDSEESMDVDEENTVPLEVDMTSLLAAAGNPSKKQEIADSIEDNEPKESESLPESPVATTRFSLANEESPETIEVVDKMLASKGQGVSGSTERVNESQIRSSEKVSQEFVNEPYTLTLDELSEIGELKSNDESNASQDSVIKFNEIIEKMDSVALSRWNQFLKAVCDEVEKQDQDLDGTAASAYDEILNEQPPNMRKMEAILRSEEGSDAEANIRSLVNANKETVEVEWNDWLKNLLEAFSDEWLLALSNDLKKEMSKLETISELGEQASSRMAAIKDEKVRRARRKSLGRRKSLSRTLEDEIKELEAQLEQEKTELDQMKEEDSSMDAKIEELKEVREFASEAETLRTGAAPSQKAYMSLRGLHSWNPTTMNDSNLSFEAVGQYKQTSNTITYNLEGPSIDIAVSRDNSSLGTMQYVSKSTSTMMDYLSTCADEHAKSVRQEGVSSPTEIATSMQTYMWNLGRMDLTISELQSLKKRYNTTFSKEGDKYVFSVEFKNDSTTLRAEFDIDHFYPSLPLEVQLSLIKGEIDLDRVRRSLRKSSKPGFGNLSRACAVLSAFVPQ